MYYGYIHIALKKRLDCSGYVTRDKTPCIYWLVLKRSKLSHGLIAHEVVHLVNMIMADRGFKPDFNNDEAQAYLTEWVTEQIYKIPQITKFKSCRNVVTQRV